MDLSFLIFFSSFISLNTIGRGRSRKYSGSPIVDGCSMYTHAQKNNLVPNKRTKPVSRQNRRRPHCLNSLIRELTFLRTRVEAPHTHTNASFSMTTTMMMMMMMMMITMMMMMMGMAMANSPNDGLTTCLYEPCDSQAPVPLPPLPYPYDSLEPSIDNQTMTFHHDKHFAGEFTLFVFN